MPHSDVFFPASPRVIYGRSPLAQVICQLRFPTILKIESDLPAEFQERIRDRYPFFERMAGQNMPAQLPTEIIQMLGAQLNSSYIFKTEDQASELQLAPDSISLTVRSYTRWEAFKESLLLPMRALVDIYRPSFFSRVGLRYVNAIDKSSLGLAAHPWRRLLRAELIGELAVGAFENHVEEAKHAFRVRGNAPHGSFLLQHGLGNSPTTPRSIYVIDLDFYNDGKTVCEHAESTLDALNSRAGRAFRWCITSELHDALEPTQLDDDGHSRSP